MVDNSIVEKIENLINHIYEEYNHKFKTHHNKYYDGYKDGLDRATIVILDLLKKELNQDAKN